MFDVTRLAVSQRWISRACMALLCAGGFAAVSCAATDDSSVPTVFYDAQVFTAEYDHPYAEAVAVRGDRIIAVGALDDVMAAAGPAARKVDLKGKFLMPGMIDAHCHPIAGGETLIQANYPDTNDSVPALVQFVAEQAKTKRSRLGDVLVINGIDLGYWTHAAEIDAALSQGAFAKQPIVLFGSDGHTAWRIGRRGFARESPKSILKA